MSTPTDRESASVPSLSVIMPAFNEEAGIGRAVERVLHTLDTSALEFEIIVINDGSSDRTGRIADDLAARYPRVRVLHNEHNLSYGISLRRGMAAARCDWILHDGADLPLAPEDLSRFIDRLADFDVVVARRTNLSAHSPWRRLTSLVNKLLLRGLFSPGVSDLNFVQFYRKSWVQSVDLLSTSPAFVTPELILRAEHSGKRVCEVPAVFQKRQTGRGHFGKPRDIAWTLRDMARLRLRTWLHGWNR